MEQQDYFMREIEKIGTMLKIIFNKFSSTNKSLNSFYSEQFIENSQEEILVKINFDINLFLNLNDLQKDEYLSKYIHISVANYELLADICSEIGKEKKSESSKKYFLSALKIYNFCDKLEKSISFDRERKKYFLKNNDD